MYDLLISAPAARGVDRDSFAELYASLHSSLVACIPGLVRSRQSTHTCADGTTAGTCVLRFRTARAASAAMMSSEWVELIDETTTLLAWDDVTLTTGAEVPSGAWDHSTSASAPTRDAVAA